MQSIAGSDHSSEHRIEVIYRETQHLAQQIDVEQQSPIQRSMGPIARQLLLTGNLALTVASSAVSTLMMAAALGSGGPVEANTDHERRMCFLISSLSLVVTIMAGSVSYVLFQEDRLAAQQANENSGNEALGSTTPRIEPHQQNRPTLIEMPDRGMCLGTLQHNSPTTSN